MTNQGYLDPDIGRPSEQLLAERTKRIQEAMQLKQPDRIPIQFVISYMLAEIYGITRQEQHEDGAKELEMLEKAALYFQPDSIIGLYSAYRTSVVVGDRTVKLPAMDCLPMDPFSS